ncbi:hypothetical protein [Qaidamihabitans albus]|uniref:hypothetical protein n=1 Tax=Qaidamihabitans albus TaxID=2795733 RepID=UPI0018F1E5EC|nr:hypothetical protein [Qaidamihabitans albus]
MQHKTDIRLATVVAAFASAGAALIHLAVIPDHWREWVWSGVFFAALALFQFGWAAVLLRSSRRGVIGAGVAVHLGAIALWAVTRAVGMPFGPHAGEPEAVGPAGILATLLEFAVVLTGAWGMQPRARASSFGPWRYRFALAGAAMLIAAVMAPGVVAALDHSHGGTGHGGTGEHEGSTGHHEGGSEHHGTTGPGTSRPPGSGTAPSSTEPTTPQEHPDGHSH